MVVGLIALVGVMFVFSVRVLYVTGYLMLIIILWAGHLLWQLNKPMTRGDLRQ